MATPNFLRFTVPLTRGLAPALLSVYGPTYAAPVRLDAVGEPEPILYGDTADTGKPQGEPILPCGMALKVHDPGGLLSVIDDELAWRALYTVESLDGDGGFAWAFAVRVERSDRPLWPGRASEPRTLTIYDGLGGEGPAGGAARKLEQPNGATLHDVFKDATGALRLGADVRYALPLSFQIGFAATARAAAPAPANLRVPTLTYDTSVVAGADEVSAPFADRDGNPILAATAARELSTLFGGARVWQAASRHGADASARPAFVLASPSAIGRPVPATWAGHALHTGSGMSAAVAAGWDYGHARSVEAGDGRAGDRLRPSDVPRVARIARSTRSRIEPALVPDPSFAEWNSDTVPTRWEPVAPDDGVRRAVGGEGNGYTALFAAGTHIRTRSIAVPKGVTIDGYVRAFARRRANANNYQGILRASVELFVNANTSYWLTEPPLVGALSGRGFVWAATPPPADVSAQGRLTLRAVSGSAENDAGNGFYELRTVERLGAFPATPAAGLLLLHLYGTPYLPEVDSAEIMVTGSVPVEHPDGRPGETPVVEEGVGFGVVGEREIEGRPSSVGAWAYVLSVGGPATGGVVYPDPLRASAAALYRDRVAGPAGEADQAVRFFVPWINPPEKALVIEGREYRVGAGCEIDTLRRFTTGIAVPLTAPFTP